MSLSRAMSDQSVSTLEGIRLQAPSMWQGMQLLFEHEYHQKRMFGRNQFLTFAAFSTVVIAPPSFAAEPTAGTTCKVNGQKITSGAVIFACHPKVIGNNAKLIWYLKDRSPMPKKLLASTPAATLFAPCDPARTPYGRDASGIVYRCDVNSAEGGIGSQKC